MKMFNNKKITIVAICCLLIAGISCRKTLDINHDPNNPSLDNGTPKIVFPVAVMGVASMEGGDLAVIGGIYGEYLAQAAAASQYKNIEKYDLKTTDFNAQWTIMYSYG